MTVKRIALPMGLLLWGCLCSAQAEFYPERIYKERVKTSLNAGWKFYRGTPSATPSDSSYSTSGWESVAIPHSASFDAPTPQGEGAAYVGTCWYRKIFTIPSAKHTGKLFIEFEGAMQIASVWLNGKQLGVHATSGYTGFSFDVSGKASLTGPNVLAVQLDNTPSQEVPPGRVVGDPAPADYYLYSGLYRDVWLVAADQCHIPQYGQQISVPAATASAASARVRVKTTVVTATAGSVKVRYVVANPLNKGVALDSMTGDLAAGQTYVFDKVIDPIRNPALWSPATPSLYTLYTQVFKDGQLVDDYVDRFGIRWYTWTPEAAFALNGVPTVIQGASLHQSMGWIESALPRSRFAKEVGLVKEMGANLIRCAHFPRDPSFYNACDELGMLVMVEVPTWGTSKTSYPEIFWKRLDTCMAEMIRVGYNHPSILAWGVFNEPWAGYDEPEHLPNLSKIAHQLDSTRMTYVADNQKNNPAILACADIEGLNYGDLTGPCASLKARILNTEYHEGWVKWCYRGGSNDNENADGYAMERWNLWNGLFTTGSLNKIAGGCMWSFNDYWSGFIQYPMGVVDHYRIPKAVFYLFRKYWTQKPSETPVAGLTPATLRLASDMRTLVSDSTDIAIITASIRAADGRCVDTKSGPADSIPVTFSVTGPADYFGPATVKAYAGKCALIIKSRYSRGTVTVSASAPNLPAADPVTIVSDTADMTPLDFMTPIMSKGVNPVSRDVSPRVTVTGRAVYVTGASIALKTARITLVNTVGQRVCCPLSVSPGHATLDISRVAPGYYQVIVGAHPLYMKKITTIH